MSFRGNISKFKLYLYCYESTTCDLIKTLYSKARLKTQKRGRHPDDFYSLNRIIYLSVFDFRNCQTNVTYIFKLKMF